MIVITSNTLDKGYDVFREWEGDSMDSEGIGGTPNSNHFARIPLYNIYVSSKSIHRIRQLNDNTKAYKLGKYRLGDVNGFVDGVMIHGQKPGRTVYLIGKKTPDNDEFDAKYLK